MSKIKNVFAREILASNGNPTIEAVVELESGMIAEASVSYGLSAGSKEAFVLIDGDKSRYNGNGMLKAVENVNTKIKEAIVGMEAADQQSVDKKMCELDGSPNKQNLGANSILGVSLAVAKASAHEMKMPLYKHIRHTFNLPDVDNFKVEELPSPMMVAIEGGKHADDSTDLQEYAISITKQTTTAEKVRVGEEVYYQLSQILKSNNYSINTGTEGAFAPAGIKTNELPFEYIVKAIQNAGYKEVEEVGISIDAAASEFYKDEKYNLEIEGRLLSSDEMLEMYKGWLSKYPVISAEDLFSEFDWASWPKLIEAFPDKLIVADDITVTNPEIIKKGISEKIANAIIIKLNQIGTLSETVEACKIANEAGWTTIFSHRGGGESNDTSMVDVAVAVKSKFIKVGPTRGERVAKYNRLMRIEEEINS